MGNTLIFNSIYPLVVISYNKARKSSEKLQRADFGGLRKN